MDKWNLIIDVAGCENCNNCLLAAKDELVGNNFPGYSAAHAAQGAGVVQIKRKVRGSAPMVDAAYLPVMCNHCDAAPCMQVGEPGAITKRADGIVLIDPVKAKGRRDLIDACPYGAIVWNEAEQLPQSWFFDAHLLDAGWTAPRMVSICPTQAIEAVKLSDAAMAERMQREDLRSLQPELRTQPRVYYRNLHRFDGCFIGGSVSAVVEGRSECVADAEVVLSRVDQELARTRTDCFGDFKFDDLAPTTAYEVQITHSAHGERRISAQLQQDSLYLGDIDLTG